MIEDVTARESITQMTSDIGDAATALGTVYIGLTVGIVCLIMVIVNYTKKKKISNKLKIALIISWVVFALGFIKLYNIL